MLMIGRNDVAFAVDDNAVFVVLDGIRFRIIVCLQWRVVVAATTLSLFTLFGKVRSTFEPTLSPAAQIAYPGRPASKP